MIGQEPDLETKTKILLDEANLAFSETSQRKDKDGERSVDGGVWDDGKIDGEFDEEDYQKILELQFEAAKICDANPELEQKTAQLFESANAENAEDIFRQLKDNAEILRLGGIAVTIFLLRFPTVQSFVNKGHPLVLAMDEYMLENSNAQNWYDYHFIAREFGWI